MWAGFTDEYEEGVWANPYSKEEVGTNLWMPGNPNGGAKENCARTYIGKCGGVIVSFYLRNIQTGNYKTWTATTPTVLSVISPPG